MTLVLLYQFTAQHGSDVNTSIFRSLRLLGALLCGLYCAVMIEVYVLIYLSSGKCWALNWHNKASVIKLVYLYSNIKMMHDPIRITAWVHYVITNLHTDSRMLQSVDVYLQATAHYTPMIQWNSTWEHTCTMWCAEGLCLKKHMIFTPHWLVDWS